jgi:hypothetical protein
MSYTLDRIRGEMVTERTAKAVTLTITVKRYDNGMVKVNGHPINKAPRYDAAQGWLGAANIILGQLDEFRRQVESSDARPSMP